jgi:hypothetical protein
MTHLIEETMMMTTNSSTSSNDGIGERLHGAGERFADLSEHAMKSVGDRLGELALLMKKHPIAAIGVGLGIGYLLARLLHR